MRTYQRSHPWLTFRLDLSRALPRFWMLLGEAQSKCEHISGVPLRPKLESDLHKIYLAKGALATTAIEGNTLSEAEVRQRIDGVLRLPSSKEYLGQEIDNIVTACEQIIKNLVEGTFSDRLTPDMIRDFNRIVLHNLPLADEVTPGEIRCHKVGVGRYEAPRAEDCPFLLERFCEFMNEDHALPIGPLAVGILKAVLAHLYLAWIHPFGDGNGRTARLVEYMILLACGVPTPSAHLLSNHYNATRQQYYLELDRASKLGGEVLPFLQYALQGFVDGLQEQISLIRSQIWDIVWRNYVYEKFRDDKSAVARRRRSLVLDLSINSERIPISKIPLLTPRLAKFYATKTRMTLSRDVRALSEAKLVNITRDGILANKNIVLSFLPIRVKSHQTKAHGQET